MKLQERYQQIQQRISSACARAGRNPEDVTIIAVTKYTTLEVAESVLELGLQHIGENRWQDVKSKWEVIGDRAIWHFIGSLQTNKVKDVVGRFPYIHSLDRLSLAEELEKKASARNEQVKVFLQVNVSGELSKHGLKPEELESFARQLKDMPHLQVVGLMTMAPLDSEGEASRPYFRRLRELRDELNETQVFPYEVTELSMGMSGDFETAVEEGATYIRLGTVLVGGI